MVVGMGGGKRFHAALVLALITGAGCSSLRMVPPADVEATTDLYEAEDRSGWSGLFADESFRIGPYRVDEVDRDWNSSHRLTAFGFSDRDATTGFVYRFREGADALAGSCQSLLSETRFVGFGGETTHIACTCEARGARAQLQLEGDPKEPSGQVSLPTGSYTITGIHETNALFYGKPAGYRIDGGEGPVAAVEVLQPGRIWLSPALAADDRRQLGCLLGGLMLYDEPSDR